MHNLPECLSRRYSALDALISDISRQQGDNRRQSRQLTPNESNASVVSEDPAIKLMCHFWNILKEEPECEFPSAVQERFCCRERSQINFSKEISVYMADKKDGRGLGRCPKEVPCASDCKGQNKKTNDGEERNKRSSAGGINIRDSNSGIVCPVDNDSPPNITEDTRPDQESAGSTLRDNAPNIDKVSPERSDSARAVDDPKKQGSKTIGEPIRPSRLASRDQSNAQRNSTREPNGSGLASTDQSNAQRNSTRQPSGSRVASKDQSNAQRTSTKVLSKDGDQQKPSSFRSQSPDNVHATVNTYRASSAHSASYSSAPLSKVLSDLHEASAYDKKCSEKLKNLLTTENKLQETITHLEIKEQKAIELLKKADCMWTCMEDQYKKKLVESEERQKHLMAELEEVEKSLAKWRKNAQDLKFQVENFEKYEKDITTRKSQKDNDKKVMEEEIESLKKRIETDKMETESVMNSLGPRKKATEDKVIVLNREIASLEDELFQEQLLKQSKEREGQKGVKEARENLTEICKRLLRKKIENEDLMSERVALVDEIELLTQCKDNCKEKCDQRLEEIEAEIEKIGDEIKESEAKCLRCNHGTDSGDIRRFCSDCPRCLEQRECLIEGDTCTMDHTNECICMSVKHKFVDNIFENIYSVLAKQANTPNGKSVAAAILTCMRKSRNGKLDSATRDVIKNFVVDSIKKNLAVTIIGGAVKTRCEMDPDTYQKLMLCLKDVPPMEGPPNQKVDTGTFAKKDPCMRWAKSKECYCPGGPEVCICNKVMPSDDIDDGGPPCPCAKEGDPPPTQKTCPHIEPECNAVCKHYLEQEILESNRKVSEDSRNKTEGNRKTSGETGAPEVEKTTGGSRRSSSANKKERKPKNTAALMMYDGHVRMESRATPALISPDLCFEKVVCKCGDKSHRDCCCCVKKDRKRAHGVVVGSMYQEVYTMPVVDSITVPLEGPTCSKSYRKQLKAEKNYKTCETFCDSDVDLESVKVEYTQLDKTPSGHWELLLQEETIEIIKKKVEKCQNNTMVINRTDSGNLAIDLASHCADPKKLSFLKRTPSGQTVMKIRKSILNLALPKEQREKEIEETEKKLITKSILKPSQPKRKLPDETNKSILKRHVEQLKMDFNLPSDLISNDHEEEELLSTDSSDRKDLSYLKVQTSDSSLRNHEVSLITTKSGNFELLVDEDFDNASTFKYHLGDRKKRSVFLTRTIPGYYELRFKKGKKAVKKNASLIRTRSGHIKVHVGVSEFHSLAKSINIFLPNTKSKTSAKRGSSGSGIVKKKSKVSTKKPHTNYDLTTARYIVVRLFYKTECIVEFPAVLKKIPGGIKAILLKRNAKYSLLDYLVRHKRLKISPTPVFMSESGVITIYLDKNPWNRRPNANLKVTLSKKNFYIVDELKPNETDIEPEVKNSKKSSKKVTISVDSAGEEDGLRLVRYNRPPSRRMLSEGCDTSDSEYLQNIFDDIYRQASSEMVRALSETDTTFHSVSSSRRNPSSDHKGADPEIIVFKDKNYSFWTRTRDEDNTASSLKIIEAYDKSSETEKNKVGIDPKASHDSTVEKYDKYLSNLKKFADQCGATYNPSSENIMSSIKTFSSMMDTADN